MVELSEFAKLGVPRGSRERICWFRRLDATQREKVLKAREAGYTYIVIASVVSGWGIATSPSSLSFHFNGNCICARGEI